MKNVHWIENRATEGLIIKTYYAEEIDREDLEKQIVEAMESTNKSREEIELDYVYEMGIIYI